MADTTCLHTTVRNTSGSRQFFSFLGRHGVWLNDDSEYSQWGSLPDQVSQKHGGLAARYEEGLKTALEEEELTIVSLPAPILYDETLDQSVQIVVDNGAISQAAVCWSDDALAEPTTAEPTTSE